MADPTSTQKRSFGSFADFWQYYLSQHQHPLNQILHVAGTMGGLICLGMALAHSWLWLLAVLPVGYGGPWLGHFLVERNRPLTFTYPVWSLRADYRLIAWLLTVRRASTGSKETEVKSRRAA